MALGRTINNTAKLRSHDLIQHIRTLGKTDDDGDFVFVAPRTGVHAGEVSTRRSSSA